MGDRISKLIGEALVKFTTHLAQMETMKAKISNEINTSRTNPQLAAKIKQLEASLKKIEKVVSGIKKGLTEAKNAESVMKQLAATAKGI